MKNKFFKTKKQLSLLIENANKGKVKSQHELAFYYYTGNNFKQNKTKAYNWWKQASEKDFGKAHFNLAMMYFNGDGIKKNIKKSYEYANLSIKKKHLWQSASFFFLAKNFYIDGLLNKKNLNKGLKYLILASDYGYLSADYYLGQIFDGSLYAVDFRQKKDFRLSYIYYKRAADKKFLPAIWSIMFMLANGRGIKKDIKKAHKYYRKLNTLNNDKLLDELSVRSDAKESILKSIEEMHLLFQAYGIKNE